jgi:hypothetical protein
MPADSWACLAVAAAAVAARSRYQCHHHYSAAITPFSFVPSFQLPHYRILAPSRARCPSACAQNLHFALFLCGISSIHCEEGPNVHYVHASTIGCSSLKLPSISHSSPPPTRLRHLTPPSNIDGTGGPFSELDGYVSDNCNKQVIEVLPT